MRFRDRAEFIIPFVRNKKVLDLGCVGHSILSTGKKGWLHGTLRQHAMSLLGVDILEREVAQLREEGYDVICGDAEALEISDTFEVIIAGDIMEHLSNCGIFLINILRNLEKDGILIISTPNPVNMLRFISILLLGSPHGNREHTCWFTRQTMEQLASRVDLEIMDVAYVDDSHKYYKEKKWWIRLLFSPFLFINYVLCLMRPQLAETQIFVLRRKISTVNLQLTNSSGNE